MAKMKNQRIYSNPEHLKMLAEEQRVYIGRDYELDLKAGCLTIYALPRKRVKKRKDDEKAEHKDRNKREEKFERRA